MPEAKMKETKTQLLNRQQREIRNKMYDEMVLCIQAEFPVGTLVKYQHGKHWQDGFVRDTSSHRILVRNRRTQTESWRDAEQIYLA